MHSHLVRPVTVVLVAVGLPGGAPALAQIGTEITHKGRLGQNLTTEQGYAAARQTGLNVLGGIRQAAEYARFMLMFLYSLDVVLPKVRSFAFSSELGEISELFTHNRVDDAIALALREYGGGSTDYGQALTDFRRLCLEEIDRRATIIVLGDARNNHGDTRSDVLKELYERSKRVIWLNPEPRTLWNTRDSEMRHYSPYCHQVAECATLAQLERFVARLLHITR